MNSTAFNQNYYPWGYGNNGNNFQPVPVEEIRQASKFIDTYFGNHDGAIDANEATSASSYLSYYDPNLGNAFGQIADALQNQNPNVDPNQDGKMTYNDLHAPPGSLIADRISELSLLARRSGSPQLVEPSDIMNQLPPPDFSPVSVAEVRQASEIADYYYGNGDGKLSADESRSASQLFQQYDPNLGQVFTKIADGLQNHNSNVDQNGDGLMSYRQFYPPYNSGGATPFYFRQDELSHLAATSGDPNQVEPSDFRPNYLLLTPESGQAA